MTTNPPQPYLVPPPHFHRMVLENSRHPHHRSHAPTPPRSPFPREDFNYDDVAMYIQHDRIPSGVLRVLLTSPLHLLSFSGVSGLARGNVTILSFLLLNAHLGLTSPLSPLLTIPSEYCPPKHSFLFTCCAWSHYTVSAFLLWTSPFSHALSQCSLIPIYRTAKLPFYIHLSFGTTNTAWSVRHVLTYISHSLLRITICITKLVGIEKLECSGEEQSEGSTRTCR